MNKKADELEGILEGLDVPEKVYGVLVTDVGRGRQISVEVEARCDVSAATIARYTYYSNYGQPKTAIHTLTEVVEDAVTVFGTTMEAHKPSINGKIAEAYRMGV